MANPQVADGKDDLQIWRLAVNILNKQFWTANKGWSSNLGVREWANTHHSKKKKPACYKMLHRASQTLMSIWN